MSGLREAAAAPRRQRSPGLAAIASTRPSQAPQFFVERLEFLVALHILRFLLQIVAPQLIEHFFDGEFVDFSHHEPLCSWEIRSNNILSFLILPELIYLKAFLQNH
jgi:hypothetical protein